MNLQSPTYATKFTFKYGRFDVLRVEIVMALRGGFAPDPGFAIKLAITTRHDSLTRTTPAAITPAIGGEVEMLSSLRNCVKPAGSSSHGIIVRVDVTSPPPVRVPRT